MQTLRAQRVLAPLRGSSWPVLVLTERGKVVVKLRGIAQGVLPLVAELVVGALADALGLPTPERCWVELGADAPSDDPHQELGELLARSQGLNLGLAYLEGFRDVTPADAARLPRELAAAIVWLDAYAQNPDRTSRNTNLMIKAGKVWLIDHGAALTFHHDWASVSERSPREPGDFVRDHLLQVSPEELTQADAVLSAKLDRELLERTLLQVPDALLAELGSDEPARQRAAYVAYLWKRLRAPRPFVAPGKMVPFQLG